MKNGCIVIRNIKNYISADGYETIVGALVDGGYFLDKIFFIY